MGGPVERSNLLALMGLSPLCPVVGAAPAGGRRLGGRLDAAPEPVAGVGVGWGVGGGGDRPPSPCTIPCIRNFSQIFDLPLGGGTVYYRGMEGYVKEFDLVVGVFGQQFRFYPLTRVDIARLDSFRRQGLEEFRAWKKHLMRCRRGKITNWVRGPWSVSAGRREKETAHG